jgi:hypothetical protein
MLDGISWACSEGVCHCSRCTRVCVSSVQRAHALTGNTGVEEAGVSLVKGAGLERETAHVSRLAMTTVTINDGGVGAVLTSGSIGRSADVSAMETGVSGVGATTEQLHMDGARRHGQCW